MHHKPFLVLLLVVFLALTGCGRVTDKVTEVATEKIVEQITGLENVTINEDGEAVAFSVQAESGERIDFSRERETSADIFAAMGFTLPLPAGLSVVSSDRIDQDGEPYLANASYELNRVDAVAFKTAVHTTLIDAGFQPFGFLSATQEVDMSAPMLNYVHPDGYQFILIAEDDSALLSLVKTSPEAVRDMLPKVVITELDGRMTPDKTTYAPGEEVRLTFISNTPLDGGAWVAVVPSDTPQGLEEYGNAAYLGYAYTRDAQGDILTLYAPGEPGSYDLRLYNAGLELASVSISVND
jgi:hypothetical protein